MLSLTSGKAVVVDQAEALQSDCRRFDLSTAPNQDPGTLLCWRGVCKVPALP